MSQEWRVWLQERLHMTWDTLVNTGYAFCFNCSFLISRTPGARKDSQATLTATALLWIAGFHNCQDLPQHLTSYLGRVVVIRFRCM